jgi:hypothetical protein
MRYLVIAAFAAMVGTGTASAQRVGQRPMDYAQPFTPAWAAPLIHVDPPFGRPGQQVRITGAPFNRRVQVFYGNQPMQILAVNKREIIATIPWYARGRDFIYVVDVTGRARTPYAFVVNRRYRTYYNY